jgi:hypothetical protein
MTTLQITEAQRNFILSNIGQKFDGTNGRELQIRTWKPGNGPERIYINLMVNGGSNASAWLTATSNEIVIDKGGDYYKTALRQEIVGLIGAEPVKAAVNFLSSDNPFARR